MIAESDNGSQAANPSAGQTRARDQAPSTLSTLSHPGRLPSGRHRIPDQEVRDHQRARLIEAISLLSTERGYANVVIADIVAWAGVSKSTFYRFYRTKDECLFDAHKFHSAALIAAIDRSCRGQARSGPEQLRIAIRSALAYLAANPQATHLLSVGILSCGPRGARRYQVTSNALRARVQESGALRPSDSALLTVFLVASTVTQTAPPDEGINPLALENELVELFLAIPR